MRGENTNNKKSSFIRTIKNKTHPYIILDKTPFRDKGLSWKAKGLLAYFMSLPNDWDVCMAEIQTHSTDGTTSFWSGVKELKTTGYVKYGVLKDENNRIKKHIYYIRESLHLDFPNQAFPNQENAHLLYNECSNKRNKLNTDGCNSKSCNRKTAIEKFDKVAATKLYNIILTKKNVTLNIATWPNTFRLLRTTNKIPKERIKKVLLWYGHHIGEDFVPVAHGARTFRDKFMRIEDAMKRGKQKECQKESHPNYRRGGDGEMGYFEDEEQK